MTHDLSLTLSISFRGIRCAQVYWLGPMAGAAFASLLYKWVLSYDWDVCCARKRSAQQKELAVVSSGTAGCSADASAP